MLAQLHTETSQGPASTRPPIRPRFTVPSFELHDLRRSIDLSAVASAIDGIGRDPYFAPEGGERCKSGEDFEGATLTGVASDGTQVPLRIDAIDATADPDILNYTVSYWDGASWLSACGVKDGAPVRAIPLIGRWDLSSGTTTGGDYIDDPSMVTFACHGAALAKCVLFGYKPWESVTECNGEQCHEVPLRAIHQACTRMIRADYCGDGTPHTINGTLVNLWDTVGVQLRDPLSAPWRTDAEWTEDGALCIDNLRWDIDGETTAYINARCPTRWSTSFECFGSDSTFHTVNGYGVPLAHRSLVRNEFTHGSVSP